MAMEGGREGHAALARSLSLLALKYYVHKRARELHSFHQKHHSLQQLQQQQQIMSLVPLANRQELLGRCWASMPLRPIHFVTSPATPRWIHERNSAGALVGRAKCSLLAFSNMALSLSLSLSLLCYLLSSLNLWKTADAHLLLLPLDLRGKWPLTSRQCSGSPSLVFRPSPFEFPPSALISETISRMTMCRADGRTKYGKGAVVVSWHYGGTT